MKFLSKEFLIENYKIIVPIVLGSTLFGTIFSKFKYLILLKIEIWKYFLFTLSIYFLCLFIIRVNNPKQVKNYISKKPDETMTDYGVLEKYSLNWKVIMGYDGFDFSSRRVFVEGPFCKKCSYNLDYDNANFWFCVGCDKKYYIPRNIRIGPMERITKLFASEISKTN